MRIIMKRSCIISTLFCTVSILHAAVGDTVNLERGFVAEGVAATFTNGILTFGKTELQNSTRFYDSQKGWVAGSSYGDSLMCWAHTASNMIQYWQSYYGVFYKGNQQLPYGSDYTRELYNVMNPSNSPVITDPMRLNVMKALYNSGFSNMGGEVATGTNWFFTWVEGQGGYYSDYFGAVKNGQSNTDGQTATITGIGTLASLKTALLPALGITESNGTYTQTEAGLIAHLNVTNGTNPHTLTCYGLTTNSDGSIKSLIIADSDDCRLPSYETSQGSTGPSGTYTPKLTQLYIKTESDGKLALYTDATHQTPFITGHTYYVSGITQINTPQVLQNMLAEYRDVSNEAQVWNGHSGVWEQQTATTEALPTESTGWDIHVNGSNIDSEHHGYYHTYATDGRAVLFDDHAEEANRQITINGTVSASHIEVAATGYEFKAGENAALAAGADMLIRQAATLHSDLALNLANLTLEAGATLSSNKTIEVTGTFIASLQAATTFSLKNAVTVPARVDADLDLSAAKQIILETSVSLNNHTLTLAEGQAITLSSVDENLPNFTDISQLIIGGEQIAEGTDLGEYLVFISSENKEYTNISFIYQNNSIMAASIPEPTTATLSLLALAALTTRRKRYR